MLNYHVKIGLAPIRRDLAPRSGNMNWEKAEARAKQSVSYIRSILPAVMFRLLM